MAQYVFTVEIAFITDPFQTPIWEDISAYVVKADTNRGRQYELDRMEPGKLTLQLHDFGTGDFDPSILDGTVYSPNVTIGKRIRLMGGQTSPYPQVEMFDGFIATWAPTVDTDHEDVTVEAYDLMRMLGKGNITSLTNANAVAQTFPSNGGNGSAYYRCDEASGTVANDQSGNGNPGTYAGDIVFAQPGVVVLEPNNSVGLGAAGTLTPAPAAIASAVSVCGWFKTTNTGSATLLDRRPPGDPTPTTMLSISAGQITLTSLLLTATSTETYYADGNWHFFWLTNIAGGTQLQCVLDTGDVATIITPAVPRSGDVTVIGDLVGGGAHFGGGLDEVICFSGDIMISAFDLYVAANPYAAGSGPGLLIQETLNGVGVPFALQGTIDNGHASVTLPGDSITSESALQFIQDLEYTEGPLLSGGASNRAIFYINCSGLATFLVGDRSTGNSLSLIFGPFPGTTPAQIPWAPAGQWRMDDLNVYGAVIGSVSGGPQVQAVANFEADYYTPIITSFDFSGGNGNLTVTIDGGGSQAVVLTGTYASLVAEAAAIQGQVTGVTVTAVGSRLNWVTTTAGASSSVLVVADSNAQASGFAASSGVVFGSSGGSKFGAVGALTLSTLLYDSQVQVEQRVAWELFWVQTPKVRIPQIVIQSYTVDDVALGYQVVQLEPGAFCNVVDANGRYSFGVAEVCRVSHSVDFSSGSFTTSLVLSPANEVP